MLLNKNNIKYLVVHCSDTDDKKRIGINEIHQMHLNFGWDGVGYHKVICRNGEIQNGRPEFWKGAHVKGKNDQSLGVCIIGREKFTKKQMISLQKVLDEWRIKYPKAKVVGHRDIQETSKTCPNFNVIRWWKEKQEKEKLNLNAAFSIKVAFASMFEKPNYSSTLVNELLFGETFKILKFSKNQNFAFVKTFSDNYKGWVDTKCITKSQIKIKNSNLISNLNIQVLKSPNIKSNAIMNLPLGSKVKLNKVGTKFSEIVLLKEDKTQIGYIPNNSYNNFLKSEMDWVNLSEKFLGVPYKWGGKTYQGIDCSGLLQMSLRHLLIDLPRDSGPQEEYFSLDDKNVMPKNTNFNRGDILFWKGHVAICISKSKLIHANAYHHNTEIEEINEAIERIKTENGNITSHIRIKI